MDRGDAVARFTHEVPSRRNRSFRGLGRRSARGLPARPLSVSRSNCPLVDGYQHASAQIGCQYPIRCSKGTVAQRIPKLLSVFAQVRTGKMGI